MNYGMIVSAQSSIKKLTDSNMVPWEVALDLADYKEAIDKAMEKYAKAYNVIQIEYGKLAEAREDSSNTVDEQEQKDIKLHGLLGTELTDIRIPSIDSSVFKKLYSIKKDKEKADDDTIEFSIDDIKAYKVLGLFAKEG